MRQKADGRSMLLRGQKETMPRENSGKEKWNKDQNFIITKKMVWFACAAYNML